MRAATIQACPTDLRGSECERLPPVQHRFVLRPSARGAGPTRSPPFHPQRGREGLPPAPRHPRPPGGVAGAVPQSRGSVCPCGVPGPVLVRSGKVSWLVPDRSPRVDRSPGPAAHRGAGAGEGSRRSKRRLPRTRHRDDEDREGRWLNRLQGTRRRRAPSQADPVRVRRRLCPGLHRRQ